MIFLFCRRLEIRETPAADIALLPSASRPQKSRSSIIVWGRELLMKHFQILTFTLNGYCKRIESVKMNSSTAFILQSGNPGVPEPAAVTSVSARAAAASNPA
jgi:hypothetical protein